MTTNPYSNFIKDEILLRDKLAIDRTELANERTMLAYVRTAFALILAGISVLHFFQNTNGIISGIFFIVSGWIILGIGFRKYKIKNNNLNFIKFKVDNNELQNENEITSQNKSFVRKLLFDYLR